MQRVKSGIARAATPEQVLTAAAGAPGGADALSQNVLCMALYAIAKLAPPAGPSGGGGGGARAYSGLFSIADWYATLMSAAGAGDAADAAGVLAGMPPVDALDHWAAILGAPVEADAPVAAASPRTELPLAWCDGTHVQGADTECFLVDGPVPAAPKTPKNGALIMNGTWKVVWGAQSGWGVWLGPNSPNGTDNGAEELVGDDKGCPHGCLFDLATDEGEHHDLRLAHPERFATMLDRLGAWGVTVFQTGYDDGVADGALPLWQTVARAAFASP